MRPAVVVGEQPLVRERLHLGERGEDVSVEDFVAVGAVETLDEGVLIGLAGLDETQLDIVRLAFLALNLAAMQSG